jgi:hypothetical protein
MLDRLGEEFSGDQVAAANVRSAMGRTVAVCQTFRRVADNVE